MVRICFKSCISSMHLYCNSCGISLWERERVCVFCKIEISWLFCTVLLLISIKEVGLFTETL